MLGNTVTAVVHGVANNAFAYATVAADADAYAGTSNAVAHRATYNAVTHAVAYNSGAYGVASNVVGHDVANNLGFCSRLTSHVRCIQD